MSLVVFFHALLTLLSVSDAPDFQNSSNIQTFRVRESTSYQIDDSFYLRILEDQSRTLNINQVKNKLSDFKRFNSQELNHEYAYWSVFKIKNESGEGQNFTMLLGYNSVVEVYEEPDSGEMTIRKSGYLMPISERDIEHDGDSKVRLFLNVGEEKTVWVKTMQLDCFQPFISVNLIPYNEWNKQADREDLFEGTFTGILSVLAVLGLIFFSYTKDKLFLYFGLYAIVHAFYFFNFYGYVTIYLVPNHPLLTQPLWITQILSFALFFAMAGKYVNVKEIKPQWSKLFSYLTPTLIVIFIITTTVLLITHNLRDAIWVKNIVTLLSAIIGLTFIVTMLRTGRDQAYYLAIASSLLLGLSIFISINFFFNQVTYDPILIQSAILFELIIFSMGIGHLAKANLLESKITQDSLILQFKENEKLQSSITQKLQESVAERTHEINVQKRQIQNAREVAEDATKAKSEFLSVMSHEIRTPLNAIISLTHLMELENENPDNQEYIDALKFSGESLHSLINDILDYSKIEAGKLKLETVDLSIIDLLQKIRRSFKFKAQAKSLQLNLMIGEYTPNKLIGDPTRLTQIVNNLVSNAIKFTTEGSVNIKVHLIGVKDDTATLGFEVSDTGIGIPNDKLKDIFEDYEQASRDTTRKYGGTGLGLAITKKLLDLHGAEIKIESTEGVGTTFKFEIDFRIDSGFDVFEPQVDYGEKRDLGNAKVLIVDDNDMNRLVLKRLFKKWNGDYYESKSGEDACEFVNDIQFDLILMDIEMPGQDGFQTAKLIKEQSTLNLNTQIIAMSARGDLEAETKANSAYMQEFIRKPFDPEVLYQKITAALKSKDEEQN